MIATISNQQWKCIVVHGLTAKATSVLFLQNNNMQTWSQSEVLVPQINTVYFAQNSIRYLWLIWNSLLLILRNVDSFSEFKFLIKNRKPTNCPYRLSLSICTKTVTLDWLDILFLSFINDCCQILLLTSGRFWVGWLDFVLFEINRGSLVFCWILGEFLADLCGFT